MVGCRDDRPLAFLIDQLAVEQVAKLGAKAADSGVQMRRSMHDSFCMLSPECEACTSCRPIVLVCLRQGKLPLPDQ